MRDLNGSVPPIGVAFSHNQTPAIKMPKQLLLLLVEAGPIREPPDIGTLVVNLHECRYESHCPKVVDALRQRAGREGVSSAGSIPRIAHSAAFSISPFSPPTLS